VAERCGVESGAEQSGAVWCSTTTTITTITTTTTTTTTITTTNPKSLTLTRWCWCCWCVVVVVWSSLVTCESKSNCYNLNRYRTSTVSVTVRRLG